MLDGREGDFVDIDVDRYFDMSWRISVLGMVWRIVVAVLVLRLLAPKLL